MLPAVTTLRSGRCCLHVEVQRTKACKMFVMYPCPRSMKLYQRQHLGIPSELGWRVYGISRVGRYHHKLNWGGGGRKKRNSKNMNYTRRKERSYGWRCCLLFYCRREQRDKELNRASQTSRGVLKLAHNADSYCDTASRSTFINTAIWTLVGDSVAEM